MRVINIGSLRVHLMRNSASGAPRFDIKSLPIRQTLIWAGSLFILIQRRAGR